MARQVLSGEMEGLLERDAEMGQLSADLGGARDGAGRAVLIRGPAGGGKTALLRWVGRQAVSQRMLVLRARGVELEQEFAFGVVRQLFERVVLELEPRESARVLSGPARAAGALFGTLDAPESDSESGSFALLHGLYALVMNLAERRPMVILIDDVHWADAPSLRWLSYLGGRLDAVAAVVVTTVRGDEQSALDPCLVAVAGESGTRTI